MVFRRSEPAPSGSQKHWQGPKAPCRRLKSRPLLIISQLQMFAGILVTCFSVILLLIRDAADGGGESSTNGYLFTAIGLLFIITGMIGVCILKKKTTCDISTYLSFSVLSCCFCVAGFVIWLLKLIDLDDLKNEFANHQDQNLVVFMAYLFTILFCLMFIIFIISIVICIYSLVSELDYSRGNSDVVPPPYDNHTKMSAVAEAAYAAHKQSRANSLDDSSQVASMSQQSTLPRTRLDSNASRPDTFSSQYATGRSGDAGTTSRNGTLRSVGGRGDSTTYSNHAYDSRYDTLKSTSGETPVSNSSSLARNSNYASVTRAPIGKKDCTLIFLD